MTAPKSGKKLDLKIKRVLKTNIRGGIGGTVGPIGSVGSDASVALPPYEPPPRPTNPNSVTAARMADPTLRESGLGGRPIASSGRRGCFKQGGHRKRWTRSRPAEKLAM
jgi:hypothetical protein